MKKNLTHNISRRYSSETHGTIEFKIVLSLGLDNKTRGFIGEGSIKFVADYGRKLSYQEILCYYPEMKKEEYGYT